MQCPQCQSDIKTIPAGVSKKNGKPYNAFQACSNRNCDFVPCREIFQPPSLTQNVPQAPKQPVQATSSTVNDNIRWCNALNNACLLIAHGAYKEGTESPQGNIIRLANWIYKLEPGVIPPDNSTANSTVPPDVNIPQF